MGMSQTVRCRDGVPAWPAVAEWLTADGRPATMRMIDGQLAFPDEEPPPDWRELRVSLGPGMVTIRREPDAVTLVIWGNADPALVQAWNTLTLAFAELSGGSIATEAGECDAATFRTRVDPPTSA